MKRIIGGTAIAVLACGGLAAPAAIGAKGKKTTTLASGKMSGKQEVPDRGDPDGSGNFTVTVSGSKVCVKGSFKKIGTPKAFHIHKGAKGKAGDVKIDFTAKLADVRRGRKVCVTSAEGANVAKTPNGFYLNVHNDEYPGGAVRGQLRKP